VTSSVTETAASGYLDWLPAIYQDDPEDGEFLGRFLLAFEHVLTGVGDPLDPGLEEYLDGVGGGPERLAGAERYFDPGLRPGRTTAAPLEQAPAAFLDWLSTWVALSLRTGVREELQRELIAKAVPLYRMRGTRAGMEELIRIYTGMGVTITEFRGDFQLEVSSRLDVDTILGGGTPFYFHVEVALPVGTRTPAQIRALRELLEAIIDAEKPAHTYYRLDFTDFPTMQIDVRSTIDVDTLIA
jgi:phage tail-like protein